MVRKGHFLLEGSYWRQSALTGQNFFDKMVREMAFLWEVPYWKLSALTGQNFFDKMVRKRALSLRLEAECPYWPELL